MGTGLGPVSSASPFSPSTTPWGSRMPPAEIAHLSPFHPWVGWEQWTDCSEGGGSRLKDHLSHILDFSWGSYNWEKEGLGRKQGSDSRPPGPSVHFNVIVARGGPTGKGAWETPFSIRSRESRPGREGYRGMQHLVLPFCPSTTLVLWNLVFL